MKWFPKKDRDIPDNFSIIKFEGRYQASSEGKFIGRAHVDDDMIPLLKTGVGVDELLVSLSLDPIQHYITTKPNIDYNDSTRTLFVVDVFQRLNINDLSYGVFELKSSNMLGNYFKDYVANPDIKTIVERYNLKKQVLEFLKTPATGTRKNKKGILLYGPPGNGKTTEIMSLFATAAEEKIRIFIVDRGVDFSDLTSFRDMLSADPTVFVLEELTQRTDKDGTEELLTFLDGETSWDNSVVIATTNYPEELPANLVDRPGRFETFLEYGNPTEQDIIAMGEKFEVDSTGLHGKDLSFDYVSFILSEAKRTGVTAAEAMVSETEKKRKLSKTFKAKGMGF